MSGCVTQMISTVSKNSLQPRPQRWLMFLATVILGFMADSYGSSLAVSTKESVDGEHTTQVAKCSDTVGDNLFQSETCARQELNTQILAMQRIYQSLQKSLPEEDNKKLADTQKQWLAFRTEYCGLMIQIEGSQNPAWQMTWSIVTRKNCEAELTEDRVTQLIRLARIVNLKNQQNVIYPQTW
jgi:uncharacterized protein YecT (DUF1311 family)